MRHIQHINFIGSFPSAPPCTELPEIAFVGRSNVGKSSAINCILGRNKTKVARVSRQPGRTQGINIFEIDSTFRFVDLPGYGFAKVPLAVKKTWRAMISGYLFSRPVLQLVVILVDGRHNAQDLDKTMINAVQRWEIPYLVVATKVDKIKRSQRKKLKEKLKTGLEVPTLLSFSSETKEGLPAVWKHIDDAIVSCGNMDH
jgi:GTP-binding protein